MKKYQILLLFSLLTATSCDSWLDIKADKKQVVPQTTDELQALLDNTNFLNTNTMSGLLEVSTDNLYLTEPEWLSRGNIETRNGYVWAENINEGNADFSWIAYYRMVYYANVALEGAKKIKPDSEAEAIALQNVMGSALFFRSWAFYHLAQLYAIQYKEATASSVQGIPLRLTSDIHQKTKRSSLAATYGQVIDDLLIAIDHLPELPIVETRPSKLAVFGLLSRIFLQMGDFNQALRYAESGLAIKGDLINYGEIDSTLRYPFPLLNKEVVFYQTMTTGSFYIDAQLYSLYEDYDYRKSLFFNPEGTFFKFRGSYSNSRTFFAGLAIDELYLIKSECLARLGRLDEAIESLKYLIDHRYNVDAGHPTLNHSNILDEILHQRRLQLVYRGLRWLDLRRLNLEPDREVTLTRELGDKIYTLPPNSSKYIFVIPDDVIDNNPNLSQNER